MRSMNQRSVLRATAMLWIGVLIAGVGVAAENGVDVEPVFRLREQRSEYLGPGRELPAPPDVAEVLIGYFGPDDPEDPVAGGMWRAAVLAVEEANRAGGFQGKPFRLVAAWAEDPWAAGVSLLARQVYHDQVWAIIGGINGETTHLAEQVVAKARLPLISPVATDKTVNLANVPWMFSLAPGDHLIAPPLAAEIARNMDSRGLVLVSAADPDSRRQTIELLAALREHELSPRYRFVVRRGEDDLDELARRVVQADPASVLVIADARDSAALVRTLRAAGCETRIFGGPAMGRRLFIERAGHDAEGVIFPLLFVPDSGQEHDFDYAAAHTYDAVQLAVAAIRRAGLNRAAIGDALRELSPAEGLTGKIRWDGLGSNTRLVRLATLREGKPVPMNDRGSTTSDQNTSPAADDQVPIAAPSVALALDGRALQPVVVGSNASEPIRRAAADLADILGRISGASFAIVEGNGHKGLAVGVPGDFPEFSLDVTFESGPFAREHYVLRSHADGIWLLGASDRAVEHAVWDLLHRLGYRLFFLTDTWQIIPERTDLHLAVDCFEKPDFLTRQAPRGAPWSDGALWNRWRTRNRITSAFSLNTGHAYDGILRANAEAFRAHPEY
jgi:branched-chain amino acid transport system substrate-binding protein